jgi:hypothetical protein
LPCCQRQHQSAATVIGSASALVGAATSSGGASSARAGKQSTASGIRSVLNAQQASHIARIRRGREARTDGEQRIVERAMFSELTFGEET